MDCIEARHLLHAYIDAELDVTNSLKIEQHLQACQACQRDYRTYQALHTATRDGSFYFQAPEQLQKRTRFSLRKADKTIGVARLLDWRWLSAAAVLLFALFGIWGLTQLLSTSSARNTMAQQVLGNHVLSLLADHLVDVSSSNQQVVQPWFTGKLNFSPPVVDLAPQGFSLLGGRLDYLDNQPVAAIVYSHENHVINLFIWPSGQPGELGTKATRLQGYSLIHWMAYGMHCWAVSDIDPGELQQFVRLVQQHTDVT